MNLTGKLNALIYEPHAVLLVPIVFVGTSACLLITFPLQQSFEMLFFFVYMSFACTFFPLPVPPIVMDFGGRYDPLMISILAAIGTCFAAFIDYTVMNLISKHKRVVRIRKNKVYKYSARYFNKLAFLTLVTTSFIVVPLEPVRFLAASTQYSKAKYILAIFIGRFSLYYLLAKLQRLFQIPRWILIGAIMLILMIALTRMYWKYKTGEKNGLHSLPEEYINHIP